MARNIDLGDPPAGEEDVQPVAPPTLTERMKIDALGAWRHDLDYYPTGGVEQAACGWRGHDWYNVAVKLAGEVDRLEARVTELEASLAETDLHAAHNADVVEENRDKINELVGLVNSAIQGAPTLTTLVESLR